MENSETKILAEKIMQKIIRDTASEYEFLQQSFYMLKLEECKDIDTFAVDYSTLYYNCSHVIELYKRKKQKLLESVLHSVLHCIMLHPSMDYEDEELFDKAADIYTAHFINKFKDKNTDSIFTGDKVDMFFRENDFQSVADIYKYGLQDKRARKKITHIADGKKLDEHCFWRKKDSTEEEKAQEIPELEKNWIQIAYSAMGERTELYGLCPGSGEMRLKSKKKSKISYKEYLRQFAQKEVLEEDPETLDLMMYTTGFEIYEDMPIVEFCEQREFGSVSDIIVAMDCSGSCTGEIAEDFLSQLIKIFEDMCITGRVNLRLVLFDTEIQSEYKIKNRRDADKIFEDFLSKGFGGTDFNCVFDYADKLKKDCNVKGLFFFSDGMGDFPSIEKKYKTVFFIPKSSLCGFQNDIPAWVEQVVYEDK